ncbi:ATP-dependent DNA ligase [Granulicella sibirica]|uniref:DNA ligase (ATP) n=1 Tax=Granulicella sibirica TaxID=2479048 RepID=A0A4Q0SYQ3_9BACT|nr:ATP-dependent DNA ligase [Granulicella sibirica]RXH54758.1 ATP-dependent DNA ligase [Granulicella sibirica]
MALPLPSPILPMLAKRVDEIPSVSDVWSFEPKWDGFRAVIFRNGDDLLIQSRDGKPLDRYFPELREPLLRQLPEQCVLDGEVVIARDGGLDFDALTLRIHPAATRVKMLAEASPASVVFFDLLQLEGRDLRDEPFHLRRADLERVLAKAEAPLHLTPATKDRATAQDWFKRFEGAGLDGVIAKAISGPYTPDKRTMLKIKHERDCDCVVAGFRWHKDGDGVAIGSLLLGLYSGVGKLQHVGVCASFTAAKRKELVEFLAPYREDALRDHPWADWADEAAQASGRMPGGQSRWNARKDLSWQPMRIELVVEVAYEHMQGDRFRHLAHFRRWRADKAPKDCTYEQLEVVPPHELMSIFSEGT